MSTNPASAPCNSAPVEQIQILSSILDSVPARLRGLSPEASARKPAPGKWSPREELGHLIDSASNNHQRIVRAQLEEAPAMPGYNGDDWVTLHGYQGREWAEVIDMWLCFNRQLLSAARAAPAQAWSRKLSIGGAQQVTLGFAFVDYVRHLLHHLTHIGVQPGPQIPLHGDRPPR